MRGLALALALSLAASPAMAANKCYPSMADAATELHAKFSEVAQGFGLSVTGQMAALFAAPTGTWTLIHMNPTGYACIVDYGESWSSITVRTGEPT